MTTICENKPECFFCGTTSTHGGIMSTNTQGSSDLDTRPAEMQRSTITFWIQRCPSCGYCSPDISEGISENKKIIGSDEYQNIVNNQFIPELAATFLARSFEMKQVSNFSTAAWSAIHAAWICDDESNSSAARGSRLEAIRMIEKGNHESNFITDQPGASEAITIDLMRRAGKFDDALKLAHETLTNDIEAIIEDIINFEIQLIESGDIGARTVSEALDDK